MIWSASFLTLPFISVELKMIFFLGGPSPKRYRGEEGRREPSMPSFPTHPLLSEYHLQCKANPVSVLTIDCAYKMVQGPACLPA